MEMGGALRSLPAAGIDRSAAGFLFAALQNPVDRDSLFPIPALDGREDPGKEDSGSDYILLPVHIFPLSGPSYPGGEIPVSIQRKSPRNRAEPIAVLCLLPVLLRGSLDLLSDWGSNGEGDKSRVWDGN